MMRRKENLTHSLQEFVNVNEPFQLFQKKELEILFEIISFIDWVSNTVKES